MTEKNTRPCIMTYMPADLHAWTHEHARKSARSASQLIRDLLLAERRRTSAPSDPSRNFDDVGEWLDLTETHKQVEPR